MGFVSKILGGGNQPTPTPAPPPPDTSAADAAAREAAMREEAIRRQLGGSSSTIATGMMGDTSAANTSAVKLLGS